MRKRFRIIPVLCLLLICTAIPAEAVSVSAQSAFLWDPVSGEELYSIAPDECADIASVTKLMTALVVCRKCDPKETVKVAPEAAGVEGSSLYLSAGEELRLETLLWGMLLESGNDAAAALAYHVSGSIDAFAEEMNLEAEALGCTNSHFQNPHGLTEEDHYSTARDLARIMAEVLRVPLLREIMGAEEITLEGRTFHNHNKLLQLYPYTTGGKTGYTMAAGRTLVSSAEKDGVQLICVTLNDGDDWNDHIALYESAFAEYTQYCAVDKEDRWEIPLVGGGVDRVSVSAPECVIPIRSGDTVSVETALPRFLYADVICGQEVGYLSVRVNGAERQRLPLVCTETVFRDRPQKNNILRSVESLLMALRLPERG